MDLSAGSVTAAVAVLCAIGTLIWRLIIQPIYKNTDRLDELEQRMTSQEETTKNIADTLTKIGETMRDYRNDLKCMAEQQHANTNEMRNHFDRKFDGIYKELLNTRFIHAGAHRAQGIGDYEDDK